MLSPIAAMGSGERRKWIGLKRIGRTGLIRAASVFSIPDFVFSSPCSTLPATSCEEVNINLTFWNVPANFGSTFGDLSAS
jgi:hypothetical protein